MPVLTPTIQWSVFTHVASIYAKLLEQKEAFTKEKSSIPTGLVWDTNMAAVSLFWETNMAAVTSCENTLYNTIQNKALFKVTYTLSYMD